MKSRREIWWLVAILLVAAIPRLVNITSDRLGYGNDEVLYAYDGWSMALTGTDHRQTGHPPLYLKGASDSWDNRTSILYPYLIAGVSMLVGWPSVLIVRLPAILASLGVVILVWAIARQLFSDRRISRWAALFVALSPLGVLWGRTGHDVIFLPFFVLGTTWAILRSRRRPWFWILVGVFLALGMYAYQPFKFVGPLVTLLVTAYIWPSPRKQWRQLLVGVVISLGIDAPFLITQITKWSIVQGEFTKISILGKPGFAVNLMRNIAAVCSTTYLFSLRLQLVFIPVLAAASWIVARSTYRRQLALLTGMFVVGLSPVFLTASTSNQLGINHARAMGTVGTLELLAALALVVVADQLKQHRLAKHSAKLKAAALVTVVTLSTATWAWFWIDLPWPSPRPNAGIQQGLVFVTQSQYADRSIGVFLASERQPLFTLWQTRYNPATFQHEAVTWLETSTGSQLPTTFGRFRFCSSCSFERPGELLVVPAAIAPPGRVLFTFTATERHALWVVLEASPSAIVK